MAETGLFLNGVYERVLRGILYAKMRKPEDTFYLQPHSTRAMARFRQDPPTVLFASTTTHLQLVSYRAEIVGWLNKQRMDRNGQEFRRIDSSIHSDGYDPGIYGIEEGMVNLIFIRNLIQVIPTFSVSRLIKISDGQPLSLKRTLPGGFAYVIEP